MEFQNKDRIRRYGKRKGDIISFAPFGLEEKIGEVTNINIGLDNNRIAVLFEGHKEEIEVVAEWCNIKIKVEDIKHISNG